MTINSRFRYGGPSNNKWQMGVMIHQFDDTEDTKEPWLPCPKLEWCSVYQDRISATIINHRSKKAIDGGLPLFSRERGGFVINPSYAKILCSYPADGGAMSKKCEHGVGHGGCVPGCSDTSDSPPVWCSVERPYDCAWPPNKVQDMMQENLKARNANYNEVWAV